MLPRILVLTGALALNGCGALPGVMAAYKTDVRQAEVATVESLEDTASFIACGAPFATVAGAHEPLQVVAWFTYCGHDDRFVLSTKAPR